MAKECTGDCLKCSFQQQVYCTSHFTYEMWRKQGNLEEAITRLEASISVLTDKNNIINQLEDNKAQNPGGAENRPEQTI